jgi:hypothetical protein
MTNNIREEIRQLLQLAELTTAFKYVLAAVEDIESQNKFVLLQAQWTEIRALYLQGMLSFEEYFKEKNRITFAFLTFLETIDIPSEGKILPLKSFMAPKAPHLNAVKKALIDFDNGLTPQFPKDPKERDLYMNTFAYCIYCMINDSKK